MSEYGTYQFLIGYISNVATMFQSFGFSTYQFLIGYISNSYGTTREVAIKKCINSL